MFMASSRPGLILPTAVQQRLWLIYRYGSRYPYRVILDTSMSLVIANQIAASVVVVVGSTSASVLIHSYWPRWWLSAYMCRWGPLHEWDTLECAMGNLVPDQQRRAKGCDRW